MCNKKSVKVKIQDPEDRKQSLKHLYNNNLIDFLEKPGLNIIKIVKHKMKPRHRGLGEECTTLYILLEGRKIESRRQLCSERNRERNRIWKRKKKARPQNERPVTR